MKLLKHFIKLSEDNSLDKELPTTVQLFKAGENITSQGIFIYDPTMAEQVGSHINGVDRLAIDVDHLSFDNQASLELRGSVGHFKLVADETGVFATDIEWSERIKPLLQDRAFRFISPAFDCVDKDSNVIAKLYNFAVCNIPATLNQTPFITSEQLLQDIKKDLITMAEDKKPEDKQEDETVDETLLADPEVTEEVVTEDDGTDPMVAELEAKLAEANTQIAELMAKLDAQEQAEVLSQVQLSDKEKQFAVKLGSLDLVKEFVEIKKLSATTSANASVTLLTQRKKPVTVIEPTKTDADKKHEEFLKKLKAEAQKANK